MRPKASPALFLLLLGAVGPFVGPSCLLGQDVELLGKIHGTRPPQAYFDLKARDPNAFQFGRALFRRGLRMTEPADVRTRPEAVRAAYDRVFAQLMAPGATAPAVSGTFHFPLILGLFSDSPDPGPGYGASDVQAEFFDGPQVNPEAIGTIPGFYDQISGGRVSITGTTFDWQRTSLTQSEVAAGVSGLGDGSRVGEFIVQTLEALDDGSVDWGLYDNDGPDGLPNSGDDDGYVDVLAVMHPTPGGECRAEQWVSNNRIWSHRWDLYWAAVWYGSSWAPGVAQEIRTNEGFVTSTPSQAPGVPFIKILDYTIQPVQNCDGNALNYIGVFAHELGHGFGLPDLYVTAGPGGHEGIGNWGLMGTGAWGCDGSSAWSPCHMSAWSKEFLGWGDVEELPSGTDLGTLSLPPVENTGKIYRMEAGDGSGDYVLLENRQPLGFDTHLYSPGLLVWQIDPAVVQSRWGSGINNDPDNMGVWLRQADGLNELAESNGGRGDAGDPFPGATGNAAFHAGSVPAAFSHTGEAMGLTLLDIRQAGEDMDFRALTRYQTVTLRTEGSATGIGLVSVDGSASPTPDFVLSSAPFESHVIEAATGEEVEEGIRVGFQGWTDGAPRIRDYVTGLEDETLTAVYGGMEYRIAVNLSSPVSGITPGQVDFSSGDPAGWFSAGATATLTAIPRTGFAFSQWTGGLAGQPNPTTLTVSAPVQAGANFDVTFSASSNPQVVEVQGTIDHTVTLEVANANLPVSWSLLSGSLPAPMLLTQQGTIFGAPLEMGTFPLVLRVTDAIGLKADVSLELKVVDPEIPAQTLTFPFLLSGSDLSITQRTYLDQAGNDNGAYDLGDLRAYVLRNPSLATYEPSTGPVEMVIPVGELKASNTGGGQTRKEERP